VTQKITLSPARDIPFNKLVLSQSNVRRVKAGVSIEELAEDIARRGCLLQSLNVRPVLNADGKETGMFEVPAGGRRYRAFQAASSRRSIIAIRISRARRWSADLRRSMRAWRDI
jgi:ParB family chromosome partitioning protein